MRQWVEASAGSGKTTDLIEQVLLLIESGQAELPEIAAITFTEKAAGELKLRVREELDRRRGPRFEKALSQLELAHFTTVHGFCQELLQERPVQACIDPLFTVLPQEESRRLFRQCFQDWFQAHLQNPPAGLARLLRRRFSKTDYTGRPSGVRWQLEKLAFRLMEKRDQTRFWKSPARDWAGEMPGLWRGLEELAELPRVKLPKFLKEIWDHLRIALETHRVLPEDSPESLLCFCRKALRSLREPGERSNAFAHPLYDWKERLDSWAACADADLMSRLVRELEPVLDDYAARKKRLGRLDFLDLLLEAKRLIEQHGPTPRYRYLFVDEFQDTDPVQASLIALLRTEGLYVVGDGKQSIYRFRRGDLGVYTKFLRDHPELERRSLSTNYRSRPALVDFFNRAFEPVFVADGVRLQVGYEKMRAGRKDDLFQPSVLALPLGPWGDVPSANVVRKEMASQTGAFLHWLLRESGFQVWDRTSSAWRPVQSKDVCLLFRATGPNLSPILEELDLRGIPHLSLSGKGLHQREEVECLRVALEAIEWPQDRLSVFATLRGPLFGFEESELFPYFQQHRHFNPLLAEPDGPVASALALLAELHENRNRRPAGETLERLVTATGFALHVSQWAQGEQCLANVSRLTRLAWQFESRGATSFRSFVEHLVELADDDSHSEGLLADEALPGVRVLTVHSSKGLEFPVVVLADPTSQPLPFGLSEASCPETGLYTCCLDTLAPSEFHELAAREEAIQRAEIDRLAYVAATRARDLLVLPYYQEGGSWLDPLNRAITPEMHWKVVTSPVKPRDPVERALLFARDGDQSAGAKSQVWRAELGRLREQASVGLRVVTRAELSENVEVIRLGPGGGGRSVGLRLHQLLAAGAVPAGDPLESRVRAVFASALWRSDGWREVPLSVRLTDDVVLEGVADLVYEDADGYTVVDFKTDGDRPEYRQQLAGYAHAIREATGRPVRAVLAIV